jgi:hypothetical protein
LLEDDKCEEDEGDVAFHGLRHPTLTGAEPSQVFGVAEAGLDVPATALAVEEHLPAPMETMLTM